jgi:hypothetical protein
MSEKVELIAAAQVTASAGPPASVDFASNNGFKTISRSDVGAYILELDHEHGTDKLVPNVTLLSTTGGDIMASILDRNHLSVNIFDNTDAGVDSPFAITVFRVRS